jgi:hypothetical protein
MCACQDNHRILEHQREPTYPEIPARIEQDRFDLGMALLHTIERALGGDLLSEGMRRTLLPTLVRDNLFLQGN